MNIQQPILIFTFSLQKLIRSLFKLSTTFPIVNCLVAKNSVTLSLSKRREASVGFLEIFNLQSDTSSSFLLETSENTSQYFTNAG